MILDRAAILAADDLKRRPVEVPRWGGTVYVREMTASEAVIFDNWLVQNRDDQVTIATGLNPMIVMLCACDEHGTRLFNDDDFDIVRTKSPKALADISEAAQSLNKLRDGDFEDEIKN